MLRRPLFHDGGHGRTGSLDQNRPPTHEHFYATPFCLTGAPGNVSTYRNTVDRIAEIARVLVQLREPRTVERLLRELLTESEAEEFSLRWEIVRCLCQGKSQRTIARELGVSLCKITRGARELKRKGSVLKRVFEQQSSPSQYAT